MNNWQLSFIAGCTFSLFFPSTPDIFWFLTTFIFFTCAIYLKKPVIAAFLMGSVYLFSYYSLLVAWDLPLDSHWRSSIVKGTVVSVTHHDQRCSSFVLEASFSQPFSLPLLSAQLRLHSDIEGFCPAVNDKVELQVRLKPSHLLLNQGVARFPSHSFFHRRFVQGVVQQVLHQQSSPQSIRQRWSEQTSKLLGSFTHRGVITALMFGDRQWIPNDTRELLKHHGVGHLLAISGLHIGLVFLLGYWLTSFIRRWPIFSLKYATIVRFSIPLLLSLGYSYIAGFGVSTLRAVAMLFIASVLVQRQRRVSAFGVINSVNVGVILLYPLSLFSMAYWLSFSAVYLILLLNWLFPAAIPIESSSSIVNRCKQVYHWLWQLLRLQVCLFLFMMPLSIVFFDGIAPNAIVSNLIAVPFVSFIVVPAVLLSFCLWLVGAQALSVMGWEFADASIGILVGLLEWIQFFEWLPVSRIVLLIWFGVILSLCSVVKLWRLPIVALLACVLFHEMLLYYRAQVYLQVHVLSVGQGSALILQRGKEAIVYDVGPAFPPFYDTANAILLPWLAAHDIQSVSTVILSHADNDHSGAAVSFLKGMPPSQVFISDPLLSQTSLITDYYNAVKGSDNSMAIESCRDLSLNWNHVTIESLLPRASYSSSNDNSCVVKVRFGQHSVLLAGDISQSVEFDLIKHEREVLPSSILLAPHHGSASSSSLSFINRVNPAHVVFTTGYRNRFLFPKPSVLDRYKMTSRNLWDTAKHGQITFIIPSSGPIRIETARDNFFSSWVYHWWE